MKRIVLIGSKGFIIQQIFSKWKESYNIACLSRGDVAHYFDLEEPSKIDFSMFQKDDFVLFTAANSSLDFCEKNFEKAYKINVVGTIRCIEEILLRGSKVLFFSSDAVYGNDYNRIYTEKDSLCPISKYGEMKKEVEEKFFQYENFKSIRLSYVFSYYDKFTQYYLNCIKRGGQAEIFHPFFRNVITINELLDLIEYLLKKWSEINYKVINACGKDLISRIQIADAINSALGSNYNYHVVNMPDSLLNIRPSVTQMKSIYVDEFNLEKFHLNFADKVEMEFRKYL